MFNAELSDQGLTLAFRWEAYHLSRASFVGSVGEDCPPFPQKKIDHFRARLLAARASEGQVCHSALARIFTMRTRQGARVVGDGINWDQCQGTRVKARE